MNFTETWLDDSINNIIDINGYQVWRGDRKGRQGGGTAIYLHEDFESNLMMSDSFESCEITAIFIEKLNTINIVIYRPPDARSSAFNAIIDKTETLLVKMDKLEPNVIIRSDFNF